MKKISLLSITICLIFSCSKTNDIINVDCSQYYLPEEPIVCEGTFCQSDTCQTYLNIWKSLVMSRNQISEAWFDNHITACKTGIDRWNSGLSFRINYTVKIEWAEVRLWDDFIIWLSPSTSGLYPSLTLPRNTLLTKDHINSAANIMAFSSRINTISPVSRLRYSSEDDALFILLRAAHTAQFCSTELYYENPHLVAPPNGHPFLRASGILDMKENKCVTGQVDLLTGEFEIIYNPCYIIN
jgi:hypothetical protein